MPNELSTKKRKKTSEFIIFYLSESNNKFFALCLIICKRFKEKNGGLQVITASKVKL